jgi:uncharacterized protein (DUF2141 family)
MNRFWSKNMREFKNKKLNVLVSIGVLMSGVVLGSTVSAATPKSTVEASTSTKASKSQSQSKSKSKAKIASSTQESAAVSPSNQKAESSKNMGTLTITITGFRNNIGKMNIALYNTAASHQKHLQGQDFKHAVLPIVNNRSVWKIENVPYGEYSFMILHDENGNSKMDYKFGVMPKEGYGWSTQVGGLSMPSFEKAKFKFDADHTAFSSKVLY